MSWNAERARKRIKALSESAPRIEVQNFSDFYSQRFGEWQDDKNDVGSTLQRALFDLPPGRAVIVETVQIYVNLINFNNYQKENNEETERAHARSLNFLHLHYGACDRVIDHFSAQRVDFHGPRVHTVLINDSTDKSFQERVTEAIDLAEQLILLSEYANQQLTNGKYNASIRVGIDVGQCVAINSGNQTEKEPLFLGSAANHAAKLAEGDKPGIFISDRVRKRLELEVLGTFERELSLRFDSGKISSGLIARDRGIANQERAGELLSGWKKDIQNQKSSTGGASSFKFHFHKPPLKSIDYIKLSPGNSIRMPLVSIFADIDGYTHYIDQASLTGGIADAVRALHIMRSEFENVLQEDFLGRKVRFIGDSIHGLVAEGSKTQTDASASVKTALRCAAALRSSFALCQEHLKDVPGIEKLGLAIGLEFGMTPISRIGIRGERSVRLATSITTLESEALQRGCNGKQTALGQCAYDVAPLNVQELFAEDNVIEDMGYGDMEIALQPQVSNILVVTSDREPNFRAHLS